MTKPWTTPTVELLHTADAAQSGGTFSDFEGNGTNPSGLPV